MAVGKGGISMTETSKKTDENEDDFPSEFMCSLNIHYFLDEKSNFCRCGETKRRVIGGLN